MRLLPLLLFSLLAHSAQAGQRHYDETGRYNRPPD